MSRWIAFLVEGKGEYSALPALFSKLAERTGDVLLRPLRVNVHSKARPAQIARACKDKIILSARGGVDLVVVLVDREDSPGCCGELAKTIESALQAPQGHGPAARVVLKDRMFGNWLVADLEALRSQPARFRVSEAMRNKVESNKADGCDAAGLLRSAALRRPYDKVKDAEAICERIDPAGQRRCDHGSSRIAGGPRHLVRAARHSRSFRHLLHVLGDPLYATGCRQPVDPPRPIRVRVRRHATGGSGV